eukprot:Rmarinus@m.3624
MADCTSRGAWPSTVQPTETAVPRISLTVPFRVTAIDLGRIWRAMSMMSSMETLPSCWMFLTFLRSRTGSLRALMIRAAAEGTTSTLAWRFCTTRRTVIRRPFQSWVFLAMSSPIFFGERPSGPSFGAREETAPTSPPVTRT